MLNKYQIRLLKEIYEGFIKEDEEILINIFQENTGTDEDCNKFFDSIKYFVENDLLAENGQVFIPDIFDIEEVSIRNIKATEKGFSIIKKLRWFSKNFFVLQYKKPNTLENTWFVFF